MLWFIFSIIYADVGVEWADKHGGLECGCRVVAKCSKVGAKWVLGQYLLYTHDFFYSVGGRQGVLISFDFVVIPIYLSFLSLMACIWEECHRVCTRI